MDRQVLKKNLLQFKKVTDELLEAVRSEKSDVIDGLFQQRQDIIDEIEKGDYNGDDFRQMAEELQLLSANRTLEEAIYEKKDEMKENLRKLRERKTASMSYYNSSSAVKGFFTRKV